MSNTTISAKLPTPMWARWVFRVFITLTTATCFIIINDPAISPDTAKRIMVYLKAADMVVLTLANMFGIKNTKED